MTDMAPPDRPQSHDAAIEPCSFARGDQGNIILRWRCQTCGWTCDVEAPGFAGDGYYHYGSDPFVGCGLLVASRV